VKTGVQKIGKSLKTLDSGFRRNDGKKTQIDSFTPSPFSGGKSGMVYPFYLQSSPPFEREAGRDFRKGAFITVN
jgi:hypothetical protein